MQILDGRKIKAEILSSVKKEVESINEKLKLVVIQVGSNEINKLYLKQKEKMCREVGYLYEEYHFEDTISEEDLLDIINKLNNKSDVTGILLQLPIPKHINAIKVINAINPLKDVDGLSSINLGKLSHLEKCLIPCTALGIIDLLDYYNIDVKYKNVCIIGRSNLIGKPLLNLMLNKDATVTICHSKTINLYDYTKRADIVISAVGIPNFIKSDMLKKDSIFIDAGTSKVEDKLYGDADFNSLLNVCLMATPVPGGVGQLTIAELAKNILKAYKMQNK